MTPEQKARVTELHGSGYTAREIGEIVGVGRGAVTGVWYRAGLSRPTKSSLTRRRKMAARAAGEQRDDARCYGPGISILELTGRTCRWPIGEPGEPGFCFCGAEAPLEEPYCRGHAKLATRWTYAPFKWHRGPAPEYFHATGTPDNPDAATPMAGS